MSMTLQFLGTGTSTGVPMIGCRCEVCTSSDPRDRRRRSGLHVSADGMSFVIDTPPEFRLACVEMGIDRVDAVLFTHAHVDHTAGFDDIRRFNTINGAVPMNAYGAKETLDAVKAMFPYVTVKPNGLGLFRPMIEFVPVERRFRMGSCEVTPFRVEHGPVRTNGYRVDSPSGSFAYAPDCIRIPPASMRLIRGVDVFIVDCLRLRPHPTHMGLDEALAAIGAVRPKRAFLTHLCHDVLHARLEEMLPPGVKPAYDGLTVRVDAKEMRGKASARKGHRQ